MRKSFTRLFSIFLLLLGLSLQMAFAAPAPTFEGANSVPKDDFTNAKPTDFATKFVVAFSEAPGISDAGGTAVIYKNGGLFKTFPVTKTSSSVVVVGKTLEITHGITSFTQGDVYSVAITDGAITGLAAGALANGVYNFTVGDYVAPVLKTAAADFDPDKGAVGVMANLNGGAFSVTIPFSEAVAAPALPGNKAVYIYKEDGTVVDIVKVSSLNAGNGLGTANITVPVAATAIFQENTKYYVSVDAGAFVDASPNKNVFAGLTTPATWTFTTRDYSAPAITASVSDITTSAAKLNVTLTEKGKYYYLLQTEAIADPADAAAVKAAGVAVTVNTANTVVTSNLAVAGSTSYEVFVVAENAETPANLSANFVKKTFASVDNTAPESVARGQVITADKKTAGIYLVFNEQVKGGAGMLDLRLWSNEAYVKSIGANELTSRKITDAEVTANTFGAGRTNTQWVSVVDFGTTLPSKTDYYIVFPSGYIKDLSDNVFTGIVPPSTFIIPINKGDWKITSSDFVLPTVAVAFATPASLSSNITVTFNEEVQKQLATVTDWKQVLALELNNTPIDFNVTSPAGAGNGTVIVIDPVPANLASNTAYTVRLRPDAVKDLNNNAIVTEGIYTVTSGDLDAFAVDYGTTTNLVANSTIKIDFNKPVKVNTTGTTWVDATAANLAALVTFKKGADAKAFTTSYDAASYTLTIIPTDPLVCNAANYTVEINGAKVKDSQGALLNTAAGYVAVQTYTVKDFNAPTVALSHAGNVENSIANANMKITFTDDNLGTLTHVDGGALINPLTITFKEGSSNGPNLAFGVAYAGGVVTITPAAALETGKTYYYSIGASVKDGSGNVITAKASTFTMVAPTNAPAIVANTYAVNGSTQTPVADKLVNITPKTGGIVTVSVIFNDNIKEVKSVAPFNTVSLTDGVSTWKAEVKPINVSGNTLTIDFVGGLDVQGVVNPAMTLVSEATCTFTMDPTIVQGSTAYTNTPAPAFAQFGGKTIQFNAKDIVAPVVTANTPVAAAVNVALNTALKLDLSEKVVLGSGNIVIKKGATVIQTIAVNSSNVTLNDAGTLATVVKADLTDYNTVYTVEVPAGAFKDDVSLNGNVAVSYNFTTVANPQPTASAFVPADNSDQVALSPLTLGMTFSEDVIKYDPLVGTRKLWYLVKEVGAVRASFNANYDIVPGTDVVVANNYIETASVGVSGNVVSISTGFTPVAGDRYYVMITPGSFLDKSTGVSVGLNPVPGVYAGIADATTWNFTTKDENAGTVEFVYTKRADNKVSTSSNITINFSRPIKKADGSAINDVDVANLFVLDKLVGPGTLGVKAFVGTISADKKVVTIPNSSLVTLGEMTALSQYNIKMAPGGIIYQNGAAVAGCDNTFWTSDYTVPTVAVEVVAPVADIKKDEAKVKFTASDNMNLATLYYTIQAGDNNTAAPAADVVKTGTMKAIVGAAPQVVENTFKNLAEETSYVVWAVAVDEAGNTSSVQKVVFTTDDATKPLLVTKPSSFDADGKLTFAFNEAVTAAAASVRIFDVATMTQLAVLDLQAVAGAGNEKKLITTAFAPAITNNLVNYYVEIDKGKVGDVPVVALDVVNTFDGLFRTDLMVTSKDVTAPVLNTPVDNFVSAAVNTTYSVTLTFSEPVQKVATVPVDAFVVEKQNGLGWDAFEVIDPANVVTNGTNTVVVNVSRTLASTTTYRISINKASFKDLAGNVHAAGILVGTITTKDVVAPVATFAPAKNATNVAVGAATLTMTFNEAIRLLDNSPIDAYDLDSLVYFQKNGVAAAFDAAIAGNVITITPAALVADATYSYGFKAKFEDASDNAVVADAATFKTVTTTPAAQYLAWLPAKKSPYAAPWPWLGTSSTVTMNFSSPIFTHTIAASTNNLPVTPANIVSLGIVTVKKNGVAMAAADLVFATPDNKTITVAPKTNWGSSSVIEVIVNGATLQVNEGNALVLGTAGNAFDASTYAAEDVIDPIVDVAYAANGFTAGFYPAKVGLAGVSPVIAKTESLKLYFNEDVKVGTGTVEIHRWDGVLAKPASVVTVADDKRTVTLGDLTGLATNQEYYAIVNPGIVVDVTDNNPYAGLTAVKVWKFTLKDDAIPQIVSYLPTTDNQPVNSKLTINFDRSVALTGAGYVALYKSAAGGDAIQIWRGADNGVTGAFTIVGNTVTVNIQPLEVNTKYFVEVAGGTFKSVTNVVVTNAIARADWTFTTEVNANPTLIAAGQVPANDAAGVVLDSDLEITFDMPVEAGSGNIQLHSTDGTLVLNFDVKGTDVTIVDNVVKVALPKLAESKQYYVIVPASAIRNKTYTPEYFAGITVPYTWKFNTGDFTAPTVAANPADGNAMAQTFNVTLTFSEKVTGVSASTLTVSKGTINSVSTEASGTIYVANITAPSLAEVILTVPATVKDLSGNALAVTKFTYKVDNFDAPALVSWTPADESKGIAKDTSLVMTFSKPVVAGTGKVNVYNSLLQLFKSYPVTAENISGTKVTIPVTGLESEMTYVVTFEANTVKDALGLPVAAFNDPTKWNFTVADFTAPKVVNVTPANASNAARTFDVTIEFSEDVVGVKENISVDKGTVTVKGTGKVYIATITGNDGDVITMTIGKDIQDALKRNKLAAAVTKTYTIGDFTAPTVVVTDPATPVATVFTVGLTFNEPVTGVADAITVTGGKLDDITGSGKNYVLTVSAKEQTSVSIVLANTIKDIAPNTNAFAGQTLTYKTGDFTAPALVTKTPTLDNTLTDTHPTFKMTFNEDVKLGAGGKLKVYKVATTVAVLEIPVTAAMINGKEVTVDYKAVTPGLERGTRYYVKVDNSAITDVAGNAFVGISDAAAWTFKTGANWPTPTIDQISLEFKVYPNPFVDFVTVDNASQLSKIVVTNIAGQTVKEIVNPTDRIQLNELRSGPYFISLYNEDGVIIRTAKIVKR